jgi:ElaB/YqjD/DUF883 family membrane-anchored ribosome-binding protein
MHMNSQTIGDEIARLSEAAKSLIEATSEMAGAGVEEARQRLAAAFASSRAFREELKEETTKCAVAANSAMHLHPYKAMAVGLGLGALLGALMAARCRCRAK